MATAASLKQQVEFLTNMNDRSEGQGSTEGADSAAELGGQKRKLALTEVEATTEQSAKAKAISDQQVAGNGRTRERHDQSPASERRAETGWDNRRRSDTAEDSEPDYEEQRLTRREATESGRRRDSSISRS